MVLAGDLPSNAVLLAAAAAAFLRRVQPGLQEQVPVHPGAVLWGRDTLGSCCHMDVVQVVMMPSRDQIWSCQGRVE